METTPQPSEDVDVEGVLNDGKRIESFKSCHSSPYELSDELFSCRELQNFSHSMDELNVCLQ